MHAAALEFDLDYRLDVRFRDANNELSPAASRPFHTSPAGPPGIAAPLPWIPAEPGYRVEVVAGLRAGEEVVVEGTQKVRDGGAVRVMERAARQDPADVTNR